MSGSKAVCGDLGTCCHRLACMLTVQLPIPTQSCKEVVSYLVYVNPKPSVWDVHMMCYVHVRMCIHIIPVVVSDGEGIVAILCCSFPHQKLPLSSMLYIEKESMSLHTGCTRG